MTRSYATLDLIGRLVATNRYGGPDIYPAAVLATNPISYWRLGEPSGSVAVDVMGVNPGTYVGSPTLGVTGLLTGDPDTAVTFNGSTQYAQAGGALSSASNWTLEAWLKPATLTPGTWQTMAFCAGDDSGGFGIGIDTAAGTRPGALWVLYGGIRWIDSTWAFPDTTSRHYIVATRDVTTLTIYVDGTAKTTDAAGAPGAPYAVTSIGSQFASDHTTAQKFWEGTIDEPAIRNRALSAAEIATLYAAGSVAPVWSSILGSVPQQLIPVSTTAFRLSTFRDVYLSVAVTFNPTAIATATCLVEMSPDNSTWTTLVTKTAPMLAALAGSIDTVDVLVPTGWYVRLTTTNATLGAATWY